MSMSREERAARQGRAVEMIREGKSVGEVCSAEGMKVATLRRACLAAGMPFSQRRQAGEKAAELVRGGATVAEACKKTGASSSAVYSLLSPADLPQRRSPRQEAARKAVELVRGGAKVADACEATGAGSSAVYNLLREGDSTDRSALPSARRREAAMKAAELVRNGATVTEACEEMGTSTRAVYGLLSPADLPQRRFLSSMRLLAALFDASKSMREIAREFKVSTQRVQQVYAEAQKYNVPGLPTRRRGGAHADHKEPEGSP